MIGIGLATFFGTVFLCSFQEWIQKSRIGLNTIYENYSTAGFKYALRSVRKNESIRINESFWKDWEVGVGIFVIEHAATILAWLYLEICGSWMIVGIPILAIIEAWIVGRYSHLNDSIKHDSE